MKYLLDANVLIDAKNRHYGFDFVPAFWKWIEREHRGGTVHTVRSVADEILAGSDELSQWMASLPSHFAVPVDSSDEPSLRAVAQWATVRGFTQGAVSDFLAKADYFLVAQAATRHCTVVTQETLDPLAKKRIKIPDACLAAGVTYISPFAMLRAENARFTL